MEKSREKPKAIVLFSGGLDSRLVVKLLQEQRNPELEIELINFKLPFGCGCSSKGNEEFAAENKLKLTIFDCTKAKLFKEYLEIIKNPKFGRGSGMNPCIDCKIFMLKKAKEYADQNKIKIIATGEVLGERPMSQTSRALKIIDDEIGFSPLRPLSAKLLPETEAEKEKFVKRDNFLSISGRGRQVQMELARKFNISYPTPGGGCLLCEKVYTGRLKDFFQNEKPEEITPEKLSTLSSFRHFRSHGKILLGRDEKENLELEKINKHLCYNLIIPAKAGPTALFESKDDKSLAEDLIAAYSSKNLEDRKKFERFRV